MTAHFRERVNTINLERMSPKARARALGISMRQAYEEGYLDAPPPPHPLVGETETTQRETEERIIDDVIREVADVTGLGAAAIERPDASKTSLTSARSAICFVACERGVRVQTIADKLCMSTERVEMCISGCIGGTMRRAMRVATEVGAARTLRDK